MGEAAQDVECRGLKRKAGGRGDRFRSTHQLSVEKERDGEGGGEGGSQRMYLKRIPLWW